MRHDRGLSQESRADALDIPVAYVSLIERAGLDPPYTTVIAVANALGVFPRDIVE